MVEELARRSDSPTRQTETDGASGRGESTCEGRSVLIKNLKFETSPSRIRSHFERYGAVRDVYLPLDYFTRRPRGFGFVEFVSADDAATAVKELHGTLVDGNEVTVLLAQDRRKTPEAMRSICSERSRSRRYDDGGRHYDSRHRSPDPHNHRSSTGYHRRESPHYSTNNYRGSDARTSRHDDYDRRGYSRRSDRARSLSPRRGSSGGRGNADRGYSKRDHDGEKRRRSRTPERGCNTGKHDQRRV